jgi:L-histidine Nalpha-methyltransferase
VVQTSHTSEQEILEAVAGGLNASPKKLPSWMLYDQVGDKLFAKIMELPEYYPTRCELEIISRHKDELAQYFINSRSPFNLIELGAGNGVKSELLIGALINLKAKFTYVPVDISSSVLLDLSSRLLSSHPELNIKTVNASYEDAIKNLSRTCRNVLLFLGANIGNMSTDEASGFVRDMSSQLSVKDLVVIGFDLKKDPSIIEAAYNDEAGVTRAFNLNVLTRLNETLGAKFDLSLFQHYPSYNPETGTASSYLVSLKDQDVPISALQRSFHFSQWETIHTEISQKYDLLTIDRLFADAGLEIVDLFFDHQHFFCDVVAMKV